jgi:hypothetical protein
MRFAFFAALRPHLFTSIAAFCALILMVQESDVNKRFWLFFPVAGLYFLSIALFAWEKKTLTALLREARVATKFRAPRPEVPAAPKLPAPLLARPARVGPHVPRVKRPGFYRV